MFKRKRTLFAFFLVSLMLSQLAVPLASAQLLPSTVLDPDECVGFLADYEAAEDQQKFFKNEQTEISEILGCAIKTGRIALTMIPYFLSYISNFLLGLVGLICVLFIVIGGYQYIVGGLTEGGKEKGKKTISHALIGMSVAILSWIFVNIVMNAVTS